MLKFIGKVFMVFLSGFVCGIHVSKLLPNPEFEASWAKVVFTVLIATVFGFLMFKNER